MTEMSDLPIKSLCLDSVASLSSPFTAVEVIEALKHMYSTESSRSDSFHAMLY